MSAAATAAGYLYAAGRLHRSVERRVRGTRLELLEKRFRESLNVSPARALELAIEAVAMQEKRRAA